MKNERTSKRVATIAAKVLRRTHGFAGHECVRVECKTYECKSEHDICTVAELKALCASVSTQAPDRKAKK